MEIVAKFNQLFIEFSVLEVTRNPPLPQQCYGEHSGTYL